eukprot:scaffold8864_cov122-Isochrysis_galbana.AAC.6
MRPRVHTQACGHGAHIKVLQPRLSVRNKAEELRRLGVVERRRRGVSHGADCDALPTLPRPDKRRQKVGVARD